MKSIFVLALVYVVGGDLLRSSSSNSNSNMNGTYGMNDTYNMNGTSNWNMHDMNSTNGWNMHDMNSTNGWNMHDRNSTHNWNMNDKNGMNNWNMYDMNDTDSWNMSDKNDMNSWNMHDRNESDSFDIYNRNRNGMNNWNMHDRNGQGGYDMNDMDDMDNETMGSGECEASYNFGGGIFNSKKFFKKITNMCIDVRFPRELYKRSKQCLKEEGKRSGIFDNMMNGKFPSKQELAKFIESSCTCQLRGGGINNLQRDLTMENLLKYTMYDRWGGDEEDKEDLKEEMTTCFNQAQGSGYQKLIEYHKCLTKFYLKECEEKDDEPGMLLIESAKLLTIGEESKCAPVKLPKDMNQVRDKCFKEAKTNMKKMPETSASSTSTHTSTSTSTNNMGGSDQDMRSMQVLKHFWMEYMMKAVECFLTELKMFDTQKKTVDVKGMTEYVQKFEGWDKISKERDEVIEAIKECGEVYEQDSDMMDSHEDHGSNHNHNMMNNNRNNMNNNNMMNNSMMNNNMMNNSMMNNSMMNNTEHKEMKIQMKKQAKFDRCFTPKFAETCGINNEVSNFFFPMMDPEFMGEVFKAFRETCGKEAEAMLMWLKSKFTE